MGTDNGNYASWYMDFARTAMVIGYNPNSRFAADFRAAASGTKPWYQVLEEPGLRLGRTDPLLDPKGVNTIYTLELAENYYQQLGLKQTILGDDENSSQIFPEEELLSRLGTGQLDAGFFYSNEVKGAKIPSISLPDQINLGNPTMVTQYATVSWTNAKTSTVSRGASIVYTVTVLNFLFVLSWPSVPSTLSDPDAIQALITSATSATIATLFMALFGVPLGYVLARFSFPGKSIVSVAIYLPLVFPPVISGIILLVLFGPYGLIGEPLTSPGWEVDGKLTGIVLAQVFVAAPFVIVSARSAFSSIDPRLEQVAATLGHNRWSLFWRVSLPLARGGIIAGLMLVHQTRSFARLSPPELPP